MLVGMSVVSCGNDDDDDDDNNNQSSEIPTSSPSVFGGMLLTSVSDNYNDVTKFYYDSNCLISSIDNGGDIMTIDYSNGIVSLTEDDYSETVRITTTKNGLLTSVSGSGEEFDGNMYIKYDVRWNFTYDSDDHLTKVAYKETSRNSAGEEIGSGVNVFILDWIDGMLSTMSMEGSEIDNGSTYSWGKEVAFTYLTTNSNPHMQYTSAMIDAIDLDSSIDPCMYVGSLGKGPVYAPALIEEIWNESGYNSSASSTTVTYTFNSNDLVATESTSSTDYGESYMSTVTYSYSDSPVAAKAMAAQANPGTKHKSLRRARHNKTIRLNK